MSVFDGKSNGEQYKFVNLVVPSACERPLYIKTM